MKEQLLVLMRRESLTAIKLAAILNVQPSAISHIVSGRNKPGYDFIVKLLAAFPSYSPKWLIAGIGEPLRQSDRSTVELDTDTSSDSINGVNPAISSDATNNTARDYPDHSNVDVERDAFMDGFVPDDSGAAINNHSAEQSSDVSAQYAASNAPDDRSYTNNGSAANNAANDEPQNVPAVKPSAADDANFGQKGTDATLNNPNIGRQTDSKAEQTALNDVDFDFGFNAGHTTSNDANNERPIHTDAGQRSVDFGQYHDSAARLATSNKLDSEHQIPNDTDTRLTPSNVFDNERQKRTDTGQGNANFSQPKDSDIRFTADIPAEPQTVRQSNPAISNQNRIDRLIIIYADSTFDEILRR